MTKKLIIPNPLQITTFSTFPVNLSILKDLIKHKSSAEEITTKLSLDTDTIILKASHPSMQTIDFLWAVKRASVSSFATIPSESPVNMAAPTLQIQVMADTWKALFFLMTIKLSESLTVTGAATDACNEISVLGIAKLEAADSLDSLSILTISFVLVQTAANEKGPMLTKWSR